MRCHSDIVFQSPHRNEPSKAFHNTEVCIRILLPFITLSVFFLHIYYIRFFTKSQIFMRTYFARELPLHDTRLTIFSCRYCPSHSGSAQSTYSCKWHERKVLNPLPEVLEAPPGPAEFKAPLVYSRGFSRFSTFTRLVLTHAPIVI